MPTAPVVDIHTHVFNAGSIPLRGVFQSRVGKGRFEKVVALVARLLERAIQEDESLPENVLQARLARGLRLTGTDETLTDSLITAFAASVGNPYIESSAADIEAAIAELDAEGIQLTALEDAEAAELTLLPNGDLRGKLRRLLKWLADRIEQGAALVGWILLMLAPESRLYGELLGTWPKTGLFVHHMMDMDNHYPPGAALYPFVTLQMRRMRQLAANAEGRLLGFVAYDPFRGKDRAGLDGVDIVIDALHQGFAGVKFYPPSGYKPTDNRDSDLREPNPPAAEVNLRNDRLFRECEVLGAPIFAHCSPGGMERWKDAGHYSDPRYWERVLKHYPRLRLCLGHAGGDEGWCLRDGEVVPHNFVPDVIRLCKSYQNVYCEFGHTETIFENAARLIFSSRIEEAVLDAGAAYPFSTKIMYGSDWHLLARTPDAPNYDVIFREIFRQTAGLAEHEERFFGLNALAYLNLPQFLARNAGTITAKERSYLAQLAL